MRRIAIEGRPSSRDELASWYSSLLEQQAASGLSVLEFAKRAGISAWTLYQWRRRLPPATETVPAERPKLIEVAITGPSLGAGSGMVVRLGDGRRSIAVPVGFDGDELRRLVSVLESC